MQYVWQHRLCLRPGMRTVDGRRLQIIDPGVLNNDAGPDFFNAKICIDDQMWVGNIEIHVRASDWHRHNHDGNPAYENVVLHVVDRDDCEIKRSNGEVIPQMVMNCEPSFGVLYRDMVDNTRSELACVDELKRLDPIYLNDWITSLGMERLYAKGERIGSLIDRFSGNWNEAIYVTLARAMGFGVNNDQFERLALSAPLRMLLKHSDSITTIEAMLMGQAGFLGDDEKCANGYFESLRDEYRFMVRKFGLKPVDKASMGWKMSRMRPQNFPHRRIATLAQMVYGGFPFAGKLLHVTDLDEARELFDVKLTGYWRNNFSFSNRSSAYMPTAEEPDVDEGINALSKASVDLLIINVVVPIMHYYALTIGDDAMLERAVDILNTLHPERNNIVALFERAGIKCHDAFTSQALIELRRNYCLTRKCLYCRIGHKMLASKALRN